MHTVNCQNKVPQPSASHQHEYRSQSIKNGNPCSGRRFLTHKRVPLAQLVLSPIGAGVAIAMYLPSVFTLGAWFTAIVLFVFAFVGRSVCSGTSFHHLVLSPGPSGTNSGYTCGVFRHRRRDSRGQAKTGAQQASPQTQPAQFPTAGATTPASVHEKDRHRPSAPIR